MNKKGATVQAIIISIIIILLSGAIIFLFFRFLPYKEMIDKEACHQSVILRSQSIAGFEPGKHLVPLNCKTQEIEISSTNEQFIAREISNAMYDCWWMLGEGKYDFFSDPSWQEIVIEFGTAQGTAKANCVVCSIIKFTENVQDKNLRIDVAEFMESTKIPTKNITYLEYLAGQEDVRLPTGLEIEKIDTSQEYAIVFIGIRGGNFWSGLISGVGGGAIVGAISGLAFGGPHPYLIAATTVAGDVLGKLNAIKEFQNARIASVRCDGEKKGCFILYLIPLTVKDLSMTCQNIESIS